jgi:hypothetical protein
VTSLAGLSAFRKRHDFILTFHHYDVRTAREITGDLPKVLAKLITNY